MHGVTAAAGGAIPVGAAPGDHGEQGGFCEAPSGLVDVLQLAALAACASSSASSTAHSVDSVVKEALLFFASMSPPTGGGPAAEPSAPVEENMEMFRTFGQRANADARAAAEACAVAHQLAATGGGGAEGGQNCNAIGVALAAARVAAHAARSAATAREAASLCMGILEEAVQANASPLARETAKRCAERALRSVEAVNVAERHNRALSELLTSILPPGSAAAASAVCAPQQVAIAAGGGGAAQVQQQEWHQRQAPATFAPPAQRNGGGKQGGRGGRKRAGSGGSGSTDTGAAAHSASVTDSPPRRWWDIDLPAAKLAAAAEAAGGAGDAPRPPPILDDAARGHEALEGRLADQVSRCVAAACAAGGTANEDRLATRAIVEWRFGVALAQGCTEEEVLTDTEIVRLATWRQWSGGSNPEPTPLPEELLQAACRAGAMHWPGLVLVLRTAVGQARGDAGAFPGGPSPTEVLQPPVGPFPGAFRQRCTLEEITGASATDEDWDAAFAALSWTGGNIVGGLPSKGGGGSGGRGRAGSSTDGAHDEGAIFAAWQAPGDLSDADGGMLQDPLGESWSVDDLTAGKLYAMATYSRAKQRRAGAGAVGGKNRQPADPSGGRGGEALPTTGADDEAEVRAFLHDVFGDVSADSIQGAGMESQLARASAAMGTPASALASSASAGSKRGKKTAGKAAGTAAAAASSGLAEPRLGAAGTASSGVHRIVEPPSPQPAWLRRSGDEGEEDVVGRRASEEPSPDEPQHVQTQSRSPPLPSPIGGWRSPYMPGQQLLQQQRLPRTFHESMEVIAVERREAFGIALGSGAGGWASPASGSRARTFVDGVRPGVTVRDFQHHQSPIVTPAGTFIGTPTWTSTDSGEYAAFMGRDGPGNPLYVQTSQGRWPGGDPAASAADGVAAGSSGSERGAEGGSTGGTGEGVLGEPHRVGQRNHGMFGGALRAFFSAPRP